MVRDREPWLIATSTKSESALRYYKNLPFPQYSKSQRTQEPSPNVHSQPKRSLCGSEPSRSGNTNSSNLNGRSAQPLLNTRSRCRYHTETHQCIFAEPSHDISTAERAAPFKLGRYKGGLLHGEQSGPKEAFHKVVSAFCDRDTSLEEHAIDTHRILVDRGILEPLSRQKVVQALSDVLQGITSPVEELETPIHEDTMSAKRICLDYDVSLTASNLQPYNAASCHPSASSYKALELADQTGHQALMYGTPPTPSASLRLPVEMLQHIYTFLSTKDFNSARRICRSWMHASLNTRLLFKMLQRGGWLSCFNLLTGNSDAVLTSPSYWSYLREFQNDEWALSLQIARHCALSSDWTGNGLDSRPQFTETCSIGFSELGQCCDAHSQQGDLLLTTSLCGNHLLVARDTRIFVYGLKGCFPALLTSVICPRRVLSMSMDASSDRHTVAAVLEGRMGIVCGLRYGGDVGGGSVEVDDKTIVKPSASTSRAGKPEPFDMVDVRSDNRRLTLNRTDNFNTFERNLICQAWHLNLRGTLKHSCAEGCKRIFVESGTSTIYRQLGSANDPPRSVAICPQRQCVAFGSSGGIDLNWVDASSGRSLSRWFPLVAPSDYLHFLAQRKGYDSAKRLRLISSPANTSGLTNVRDRTVSMLRPYGTSGSPGHEHYHAIPLSDGHHILFLDPKTNILTLGCDETKNGSVHLVRKIRLISPRRVPVPTIYAAAADLTQGARIVVAYGNTVMLYNIPPDVLDYSRLEQEKTPRSAHSATRRMRNHWRRWRNDGDGDDDDEEEDDESAAGVSGSGVSGSTPQEKVWPLALRGRNVGTLQDICSLAIQTEPDVSVWAFSKTEQGKRWQFGNAGGRACREGYVCEGGSVHFGAGECVGSEHDEGSEDKKGQASEPGVGGQTTAEGKASAVLRRKPKALAVENNADVEGIYVAGCLDGWYNEEGDVVTWCDGEGACVGESDELFRA